MSKILLHIGYPKAGSTFLGSWFYNNPNFRFYDLSKVAFNNINKFKDCLNNTSSDKTIVIKDTRFITPHNNDFKEFSNIFDTQKKIAEKLFLLFPTAKILIVTRGFESAIKANYSQYVKEGGILSFNNLIKINKNSQWLPFNYNEIIEYYINLFGNNNVLIIPFELLKNNQNKFIYKIENFVNISHIDIDVKDNNPSLTPQGMEFIRIINITLYFSLYILGPFQKYGYRIHLKILDTIKTKSWNNILFITLSKLVKNKPLIIEPIKEIRNNFQGYSDCLRDNPDFQPYKKEYFLD
ncbi:MAG: sulfotransferase domain-containing protein [Bacteroidia bacterium]|nr:sulfotransferase domain-containing protein [Bacteroidia bacterium]